jgi:uncharacterized protein YjbJ (UPF0337 family)
MSSKEMWKMYEDRIEGAARNIGGKVQEAVGDFAGDASTQVRGKVNQAAGRVQSAAGGLADELKDLPRLVEDTVRERPLPMLGIAIALGVFIGFFVRR